MSALARAMRSGRGHEVPMRATEALIGRDVMSLAGWRVNPHLEGPVAAKPA